MQEFIKRHQDKVIGCLEGFDRLILHGSLQAIVYGEALSKFLYIQGIRFSDYKSFTIACTQTLARHAQQVAMNQGRPYRHLPSPKISKEDIARRIAEQDGIREGLICVLACIESCMTVSIRQREGGPKLVREVRKCNFYYFYYMHPEFGLMHVRLQSWLPFDAQVYVNGRSYLQRQMEREGIGYIQRRNCFVRIDDIPRAQELLDQLRTCCWEAILTPLVMPLNPLLGSQGPFQGLTYYWTIRQSEIATDVMFQDEEALAGIYPSLCRHVMERHDGGRDVLRFFGKKESLKWRGEVVTEVSHLAEGVRIRHRMGANSIKMYDKEGSVLRIETTINDPGSFRVFRKAQNAPNSALAWRVMCKGVSETSRRVEVSLAANRRYLDALAVVGDPAPAHRVLDPICQPVRKPSGRARALRPVGPEDAKLFEAVLHGEHTINGFTNGDIQSLLYASPARGPTEARRRSSRMGRSLRMLRCHGLIHKVGPRRLYRVSSKGNQAMTLALAIRQAATAIIQAA